MDKRHLKTRLVLARTKLHVQRHQNCLSVKTPAVRISLYFLEVRIEFHYYVRKPYKKFLFLYFIFYCIFCFELATRAKHWDKTTLSFVLCLSAPLATYCTLSLKSAVYVLALRSQYSSPIRVTAKV